MEKGSTRPPPKKGRSRPKRRGPRDRTGPRGPPVAPQSKITLRQIGNPEQYGSVKQVAHMIRQLVKAANDNLAPDQQMDLDEGVLKKLVDDDEAALAAKEAWEKREAAQEETAVEGTGDEKPAASTVPSKEKIEGKLSTEMQNQLKINESGAASSSYGGIATRVLYVVPPKKTRRRGEKPGCAYLVLTAPPIEARTAAAVATDPMPASNSGGVAAAAGTGPAPAVDYSRDVAKRRLTLLRAVESMKSCAEDDAKSKQEWAGCIVEESPNGKTWKATIRRDRLDGTLEDTGDYKKFLEQSIKEKEERMARPKPAPGGGVASLTATVAGMDSSSDQPVAALVLHLRAKHEEQKKRKQAKRKAKEAIKKGKAKEANSTSAPGVAGGGGEARKKKKKNKKKGPKPSGSQMDGKAGKG